MKNSVFSYEQVTYAIKQVETGTSVTQVIHDMGISEQTFFRWKKKYSGMTPSEAKKIDSLGMKTDD
ncbi:MAG: transposase [Rectinemataceae bacterium]|nr:transposase [Rectinemataceae bacterium]